MGFKKNNPGCKCCGDADQDCGNCEDGTHTDDVLVEFPAFGDGLIRMCPFDLLSIVLPSIPSPSGVCVWTDNFITVDIVDSRVTYTMTRIPSGVIRLDLFAYPINGNVSIYYHWMLEIPDPTGTLLIDCSIPRVLSYIEIVDPYNQMRIYCVADPYGVGDVTVTPVI